MLVTKNNINNFINGCKSFGIDINVINIDTMELEVTNADTLVNGLHVEFKGRDGRDYIKDGDYHNNVTEVHFNYNGNTFAIESNIHCQGRCPHNGNVEISAIYITTESIKHDMF